ncbi:insulin-like [Limulus polyphemus]|uniref:Insulin-like n=1 Tax=Limulus polyphemus TaxID=6850 RepID=A0ABM1S5V0_LIMPO|nr:insulin-like [Limulus polyphemus]
MYSQMNWQFLLSMCLCAAVVCVQGLPNNHRVQKRSQKICGTQLAEALAIVCHSFYYSPFKRVETELPTNDDESDDNLTFEGGLLHSRSALSLFGKRDMLFRKVRGVTDECCRKGCTITELTSYCGRET